MGFGQCTLIQCKTFRHPHFKALLLPLENVPHTLRKTIEMSNISQNIKLLRSRWRVSQQFLADYLGVSRNVVMNWERGRSVPDHTALSHLSRLSGISIGDIASLELDPATIPAQPPMEFVSADYIDKRLEQIEGLLSKIDNKIDKIKGVKG